MWILGRKGLRKVKCMVCSLTFVTKHGAVSLPAWSHLHPLLQESIYTVLLFVPIVARE